MIKSVLAQQQVMRKRMNNHLLYGMIGDSNISGGVTALSGGEWPSAYFDVDPRTKILYRDNRTTGDFSTLRWLTYDPTATASNNRFPGYGPVGTVTTQFAGLDQPFMWYMRQNSIRPVGLLKWALGGTTLISRAGTDNDWGIGNNEMYRYWVVDYAKCHNRDGVYNSRLRAIIVGLGTNDCHTSVWNNTNFRASMPAFIAALRSVHADPNLPIYWVQVRADLADHPSGNYTLTAVTECRQAITDFCFGGADAISNVFKKDWAHLGGTSDGVHWDADLCQAGGLEIAENFLTLYGGS